MYSCPHWVGLTFIVSRISWMWWRMAFEEAKPPKTLRFLLSAFLDRWLWGSQPPRCEDTQAALCVPPAPAPAIADLPWKRILSSQSALQRTVALAQSPIWLHQSPWTRITDKAVPTQVTAHGTMWDDKCLLLFCATKFRGNLLHSCR